MSTLARSGSAPLASSFLLTRSWSVCSGLTSLHCFRFATYPQATSPAWPAATCTSQARAVCQLLCQCHAEGASNTHPVEMGKLRHRRNHDACFCMAASQDGFYIFKWLRKKPQKEHNIRCHRNYVEFSFQGPCGRFGGRTATPTHLLSVALLCDSG